MYFCRVSKQRISLPLPEQLLQSLQNVYSVFTTSLGYDYSDYFEIENDYCTEKYVCSDSFYQTFPDKNCYCDKQCGVLGDCCKNYENEIKTNLKKEQFSCILLNEIIKNEDFGVYMVTECSSNWKHESTKRLCEEDAESDDIFLSLPVTDYSVQSVMYRNMYCAQCNYVYSFDYWKPQMMCVNDTGVRGLPNRKDCDWFFIRPRPEVTYRMCQLRPPVITTCSDNIGQNVDLTKIDKNCTHGGFELVYDTTGNAYRNKFCAMCNGVNTELYCEHVNSFTTPTGGRTSKPKKVYSFRILVDFNEGTVSQNEVIAGLQTCNDNEKYDVFSQKCREIYCSPPSHAINGSCVLGISRRNIEGETLPRNCTLVKLDPSEYSLINSSQLLVFTENKIYTEDEFQIVGSDIFVCLQNVQECENCNKGDALFQLNLAESYLTLVTLILSIVSLSLTLIVYVIFTQLRNLPGKILVCLIISLLFAQTGFLVSAEFESWPDLCKSIAVLIHYFYLAAFCWMNVMAFDMWMTFSRQFLSSRSRQSRVKFLKYNFYGWAIPLLIVSSAVVLDFIEVGDNYKTLKPEYGKGTCWISSKNALLLFFAGPLALFKFFDIVSFIFTAINIARARQQGAMATKRNTCSFFINLKLSLIMGLTWVFAFVANFLNEPIMWYLFIIFNCLQGLFLAICFLCTRKVGRLLHDKCQTFSKKSSSGTHLTSFS